MINSFFKKTKRNKVNFNLPLSLYLIALIIIIVSLTIEICTVAEKEPHAWIEVLDSLIQFKNDSLNKFKNDSNFKPTDSLLYSTFPSFLPDCLKSKGGMQKLKWAKKMSSDSATLKISQSRLDTLQYILTQKGDPLFLSAREKFDEETKFNESLKTKLEDQNIKSKEEYFSRLIGSYLFIVLFCIGSNFSLYKMSKHSFPSFTGFKRWKINYLFFTLLIFFVFTALSFYTSALETDKRLILPSSFFVSFCAWSWERLSLLGVSMIMSIPITQLWCLTRLECIPKKISLTNLAGNDGKFSVQKYIFFLQINTFIVFFILSLITIILIDFASSQKEHFERSYLLGAIGIAILLMFFVGRMIRNAVFLRMEYQKSLSKKFASWQDLEEAKVLPDPTIDFIGESWWKLPINFIGIVTVIWALFTLINGIVNTLHNATK